MDHSSGSRRRTPPSPAVVTRHLPLSAEDAWALVTDVRNHGRWIPMTRMDAPAVLTPGAQFTAVTGPGATAGSPGLADRMTVLTLVPPDTASGRTGRVVLRKDGPVLLGTAEIVVVPRGPDDALVTWVEDVHLRFLPARWTRRPLRPVLAGMSRYALRQISREVSGGARRNDPPPIPRGTQRSVT